MSEVGGCHCFETGKTPWKAPFTTGLGVALGLYHQCWVQGEAGWQWGNEDVSEREWTCGAGGKVIREETGGGQVVKRLRRGG